MIRRLTVFILVSLLAPAVLAEPLPVPFSETFTAPQLDVAWTKDVSGSNTITIKEGRLEIRARTNTYAHIQRPLGADFVRAACAVKWSPAITWCTSLFIYWNSGNWCQLGVIDREGGTYYALEMTDGKPHEYSFGKCDPKEWQHIAIELGADCIRYLGGAKADDLRLQRIHRRPKSFYGAPQMLIVGKGHGGASGYAAPDLNNDYAKADEPGTSFVDDIRVTPTAWAALRATAEERQEWERKGLDIWGEQELATADDPTLDSVARHFPAMKFPREVVGVKDHPRYVGVAADGALQLNESCNMANATIAFFEIGEPSHRFGAGKQLCRKHLLHGWMPIVVAKDTRDGLDFEQTVFGYSDGFSPDTPLFAYVRLLVTNGADASRSVLIRFRPQPASDASPPQQWTLEVPTKGSTAVELKVPYEILKGPAQRVPASEFDGKLKEAVEYWTALVGPGARFEIPEKRVQDAYRAWMSYNFLNVHKRDGIYHICDGSGFYNQIYGYSAALYCLALDLLGYHDQARIYLDSLLTFQQPDGLFCVNFGHTDTGTLLHVMSEHYRITRDAEWLKRMAPKMGAMCNWLIEQRKKSMVGVHGGRHIAWGLIYWRPYCDYILPAYDYYGNSYDCVGMAEAAAAFADVGLTAEAARLKKESEAFRKDILASMDAAIITHDGTRMLPIMPDTQALLKETNYTANGYYGLVASCLLETGILPVNDPRTDLLVNMLQRKGGLVAGVCQFQDMIDHAYTYGYWMTCLKRDEVKRVILGLYGSMAYGMSRDTYAAVECHRIRSGENWWTLPHTYSNTKQLRLVRNMLLREEGDELLLAYVTPRPWLADGQRLAVREAPTSFGPVSYSISSQAASGVIRVHLEPPTRSTPTAVKLRLRHPARLNIKSVESKPEAAVNFKDDVLELARPSRPVDLVVKY